MAPQIIYLVFIVVTSTLSIKEGIQEAKSKPELIGDILGVSHSDF